MNSFPSIWLVFESITKRYRGVIDQVCFKYNCKSTQLFQNVGDKC